MFGKLISPSCLVLTLYLYAHLWPTCWLVPPTKESHFPELKTENRAVKYMPRNWRQRPGLFWARPSGAPGISAWWKGSPEHVGGELPATPDRPLRRYMGLWLPLPGLSVPQLSVPRQRKLVRRSSRLRGTRPAAWVRAPLCSERGPCMDAERWRQGAGAARLPHLARPAASEKPPGCSWAAAMPRLLAAMGLSLGAPSPPHTSAL